MKIHKQKKIESMASEVALPSEVKIFASLVYICERTSKGKWTPIQPEDINIDIPEKIQKLQNEKKNNCSLLSQD